ncbi:MAG: nucleotidyltransferase domain-containing protein [Chloroflexota bacterium]
MLELAEHLPLKRVWLFGSWAKGRATVFSDIDLLVVYSDPPREDAYSLAKSILKIRGLEPHLYTEEQAEALKKTVKRMTEGGIVLYPV